MDGSENGQKCLTEAELRTLAQTGDLSQGCIEHFDHCEGCQRRFETYSDAESYKFLRSLMFSSKRLSAEVSALTIERLAAEMEQKHLIDEEIDRFAKVGNLSENRQGHLDSCKDCKERFQSHWLIRQPATSDGFRRAMRLARRAHPRWHVQVLIAVIVVLVGLIVVQGAIFRVHERSWRETVDIQEQRAVAAEKALEKLSKDCQRSPLDKGTEKE